MLERLTEGWGCDKIAQSEGLTERRVRRIVTEHLKRREAIDSGPPAPPLTPPAPPFPTNLALSNYFPFIRR